MPPRTRSLARASSRSRSRSTQRHRVYTVHNTDVSEGDSLLNTQLEIQTRKSKYLEVAILLFILCEDMIRLYYHPGEQRAPQFYQQNEAFWMMCVFYEISVVIYTSICLYHRKYFPTGRISSWLIFITHFGSLMILYSYMYITPYPVQE